MKTKAAGGAGKFAPPLPTWRSCPRCRKLKVAEWLKARHVQRISLLIGEAHFLDGQYAAFGNVTESMDVVLKIRKGDRMTKVYVQ